ncbi:hypothetical protein [Actinacidiphila alni]|nr:hypothetical protein [Actinacidiphila alni]
MAGFDRGGPPRPAPTEATGRRETMKKMSVRKAGTIRLTSSAYYCCSAL